MQGERERIGRIRGDKSLLRDFVSLFLDAPRAEEG
jgi:hypothetical protein